MVVFVASSSYEYSDLLIFIHKSHFPLLFVSFVSIFQL